MSQFPVWLVTLGIAPRWGRSVVALLRDINAYRREREHERRERDR